MTQSAFNQKYPNYKQVPTHSDLFKGFELYDTGEDMHLFKVTSDTMKGKQVKEFESHFRNSDMEQIEKYLMAFHNLS